MVRLCQMAPQQLPDVGFHRDCRAWKSRLAMDPSGLIANCMINSCTLPFLLVHFLLAPLRLPRAWPSAVEGDDATPQCTTETAIGESLRRDRDTGHHQTVDSDERITQTHTRMHANAGAKGDWSVAWRRHVPRYVRRCSEPTEGRAGQRDKQTGRGAPRMAASTIRAMLRKPTRSRSQVMPQPRARHCNSP